MDRQLPLPLDLSHVITEPEARVLLEPHFADIAACLRAGWTEWRELSGTVPRVTSRSSKRTRASFVYDAITTEARRRFRGRPGVDIRSHLGFLLLIFDGRLVVRFKKFRYGLKTSNIPTEQQLRFDLQMPIDGMPVEATRVVAGYRLNRLEDDIVQMAVTCSVGGVRLWVIDIPETAAAGTPVPIPTPTTDPAPPRVRKASDERQRGAAE